MGIANYRIVAVLVLLVGGCNSSTPVAAPHRSATNNPLAPSATEPCGVPANLFAPSSRIYSGAEPTDCRAFAAIAALGVGTVVSVDGVAPNVTLAAKHGLRYVHIPIGYDGVDEFAQRSLSRLVSEVDGSIYIHCHHGRHRGPAAAAIACMADGDFTSVQAIAFLKSAGTSREYEGLYRDVAAFVRASGGDELPMLVETADIEPLAAQMARIDRHFERLTQLEHAERSMDAAAVARTALLLKQAFRELGRTLSDEDHEDSKELVELMAASEQTAARLHRMIPGKQPTESVAIIAQLRQQCTQCHERFRDGE